MTISQTLYRPREGTGFGRIYSNLEKPWGMTEGWDMTRGGNGSVGSFLASPRGAWQGVRRVAVPVRRQPRDEAVVGRLGRAAGQEQLGRAAGQDSAGRSMSGAAQGKRER